MVLFLIIKLRTTKIITLIVITTDEEILKNSIEVIKNIYEQYKNRNFKVVISSSYEKLHKLSNGVF